MLSSIYLGNQYNVSTITLSADGYDESGGYISTRKLVDWYQRRLGAVIDHGYENYSQRVNMTARLHSQKILDFIIDMQNKL